MATKKAHHDRFTSAVFYVWVVFALAFVSLTAFLAPTLIPVFDSLEMELPASGTVP